MAYSFAEWRDFRTVLHLSVSDLLRLLHSPDGRASGDALAVSHIVSEVRPGGRLAGPIRL